MIIRFRDEMETRIRNALAISKRAVENYHGKIIGISGEVSQSTTSETLIVSVSNIREVDRI